MNKEIAPVLAEIEAVLKKHDVAGFVIVGNKTHVDYRLCIEPRWSCAYLEKLPDGACAVRVKSKRADYPTPEAQHEALEKTIGTFVSMTHTMDNMKEKHAGPAAGSEPTRADRRQVDPCKLTSKRKFCGCLMCP